METFATPQPTQPIEPRTTNWPKIILAAVLGFGLLFGAAYAGYWYGNQEISNLKTQISKPTSTPTPAPLFETTPTPTPTQPITDPTVGWKTYTNSRLKYAFKYPTEAVISDVDEFDKGDCIRVGMGFAHLSIKGPEAAAGGCIETARGAIETYEPISETIKIAGRTYVASGDREDSSKNPDAKVRFREFLRIENLNEVSDFILEYGGSYNPSEIDTYRAEKEIIKTILSTFKFL